MIFIFCYTPNRRAEISFLLPNHPSRQPLFHQPFQGKGMFLTIEVDEVDNLYQKIRRKGIEIKIDLRNEPWATGILPSKTRTELALIL